MTASAELDLTRDYRRTVWLAETIELAVADVQAALATEGPDRQRALRAVLHLHLSRAYAEGAGWEADLRSALDTARAMVARLKRELKEYQRRVSAER